MLSGLRAAASFWACFLSLAKALAIERVATPLPARTPRRVVSLFLGKAQSVYVFHRPLRQVPRARTVLHTNALLGHDARRDHE